MGCYDMFCNICGGPFTSFDVKYYPDMNNIDTKWLQDAVVEYYDTNRKVEVCYYDGYGRFEEKNGTEHDVIEAVYDKKVVVYHKICQSMKSNTSGMFRKYQQQFFNIDGMIKDKNHHMLDKSYIVK
jgi:hypothetical protein